jgi:hypothetical protein
MEEDDQLRTRLLEVADICQPHLPMDTSLFYQTYIHGHCNVHKSSHHTVTAWLQAMADQGLVVVQKQQQVARNYRKRAMYKVVVAVGQHAVKRYNKNNKENYNIQRKPATKEEEQDRTHLTAPVAHTSTSDQFIKQDNNNSPSEAGAGKQLMTGQVATKVDDDALETPTRANKMAKASQEGNTAGKRATKTNSSTRRGMDQALCDCLDAIPFSQQQDKFPMDIGTFYQHYILSKGCQIQSSSFSSVRDWLETMQRKGCVLLKRQRGKSRAWSTVIVAAGRNAVQRIRQERGGGKCLTSGSSDTMKNNAMPKSEKQAPVDNLLPARPTNADLLVERTSASGTRNKNRAMVQATRHAKDRQKQRRIANQAIESIVVNKKNVIRRSHNGTKTFLDQTTGVTAVVTSGRKHKVITTWKEDLPAAFQETLQKEWSSPFTHNDTSSPTEVKSSESTGGIVTVSQTYARYPHRPDQSKNNKKWKEGALIRKRKRYRLDLWIVGLPEHLVSVLAKRFQNQVACPCSLRPLEYSTWYSMHPRTMKPLAEEGTATIHLRVASECRVISSILQQVAIFVPRTQRRYVKENLKEARQGNPYVMELITESTAVTSDDGTGSGRDTNHSNDPTNNAAAWTELIRKELLELYKEHAPAKVNDVGALLAKYHGKEEKLLEAVRRKYTQNHQASPTTAEGWWVSAKTKDDETNNTDLFGDYDLEADGSVDIPCPEQDVGQFLCREEEDISSYF